MTNDNIYNVLPNETKCLYDAMTIAINCLSSPHSARRGECFAFEYIVCIYYYYIEF